ncbi:hypothetical protein [Melittangium boletus]|uniref:hypothetical protein n=1 Tax=Melittangium boletus TaxID=83453 RepID=UPI003DA52C4D
MKPLASRRPISLSPQKRACTLSVSRAVLERRLGKPTRHEEDGDGLGPRYRWESTCDCGLELFVDLPVHAGANEPSEASLWMEHLEVEHALAHLGLTPRDVVWRADLQHPLSLEGWALVRVDARGDRQDQCVLPLREHAECLGRMLEARGSKHSYTVESRGMPSRQGWSVIRQDAHGNQYAVAVHPRRTRGPRLVAS